MSGDGKRVASVTWYDEEQMWGVDVWDVERGIRLHDGMEQVEDLEEITSRFLRTADMGTASRAGRTSQIFSTEREIVQRREDGSETVLVQLEGDADLQIDQDHGVIFGWSGHLVVIMKLVV
ncbi:unnamed protein product [Chondrus crispus]|uniref:Uncharacterized protein n=1 Tax=Chondrus crispus TaxID=2769 RepID=R7QSE8_CHOCR|nr:unnamed protein product [Chondrus crispus]CDF40436.1 unnamed protein product [Chondrus crispus]|eukprot:XP_005710730.1 unnamed protein product [Chondrus crispus]